MPLSEPITERFQRLLTPKLAGLFGFALRLTRDRAAAEDLLQGSLATAFSRFEQLHEDAAFGAWMGRIVYRRHVDRGRKRTEELVDPTELDNVVQLHPGTSDPHREAERAQLSERLVLALDMLPDTQREAVWLVDGQGFKFGEASQILGVPPGTVASRVVRGRLALRRELMDVASDMGVIR